MEAARKYLVFQIRGSHYGLPLGVIREVIVAGEVTALPNAGLREVGVINLRGEIISVIDLAAALARGKTELHPSQSCIVIAHHEAVTLGILVDQVLEVKAFAPEVIMTMQAGNKKEAAESCIAAFVQDQEFKDLLIIVDLGKLVSSTLAHSGEKKQ